MPIILLLLAGGAGLAWWLMQSQSSSAPALPGSPDSPSNPSNPASPQPSSPAAGPTPASPGPAPGPVVVGPSSSAPPAGTPLPPFSLSYPGSGAYSSNSVYIRAYQSALKFLAWATSTPSFDPGVIDGKYGPATQAAVKAFEKAHGLTVDGQCGSSCSQALQAAVAQAATSHNFTAGVASAILPAPACGAWAPIGPAVAGVSPALRALILVTMPALSAHPSLPPAGSTFTATAGGVLVAWYNAAGMLVPVAYCTAIAPSGAAN